MGVGEGNSADWAFAQTLDLDLAEGFSQQVGHQNSCIPFAGEGLLRQLGVQSPVRLFAVGDISPPMIMTMCD